MEIQHSVDCLGLSGYVGEPIQDVIDELKALKEIAKKKKLKNVRVLIAPRNNLAQIDMAQPVNSRLRLFVVGEKVSGR